MISSHDNGNQSDSSVRVLVYAASAREGGGITYLENLLNYFPTDGSLTAHVLAPANVRWTTAAPFVRRLEPEYSLDNLVARGIWEKTRLRRMIEAEQFDVLFCPGGTIPIHSRKVKSVATFQNMLPFDVDQRRRFPLGLARTKWFLLRHFLANSIRKADLVIFISAFGEQVVRELGLRPAGSSVRIWHGIDDIFREKPSDAASQFSWLPSHGYILYVSAFDYYKSHVELVRAFAIARQRFPLPQKLVLVGPDRRGYRKRVEAEIDRHALADAVIIRDEVQRTQLPAIYQGADACVFPSECENCPFILLEMLAAGCPILCSDRPPMPEVAADGAIYCDPNNTDQMAAELVRIIQDAELRKSLSLRARARSQAFDWRECAARTWQAIAAVTDHPKLETHQHAYSS